MQKNGSEILIECLVEQGVDLVFGYPGGAVLNIYDALYKNADRIKHILTSHEQGASHAADGYARTTGRVGVCIATSGPGATNTVTGIATAYMDSVPIVVITGNVATHLLGKDSFQEIDIAGITMPITKHNYIVKDINKMADIIREAFYIANTGRPGPVLIDIPKDISAAITDFAPAKPKTKKIKPFVGNLEEIANIINSAKKPIIYSGGGVGISKASEELLEFAEKIGSPVCTSLMGLGGFPETHELSTGLVGMHGTKASNLAVTNSDVLIAIGARFSDRIISDSSKFATKAKIIHIDIDPAEIGKNLVVNKSIVGDVKQVLTKLLPLVDKQEHKKWLDEIAKWHKEFSFNYQGSPKLTPEYIMKKIYEETKGNAIITTEVGQHQLWAAQFFKYTKPRTFISSGGLGTMGYGLGASIGVACGKPKERIIHIAGDGSFRMNLNELSTVEYYDLPIITIILDNRVLGMVRQWQKAFYNGRYSQTDLDRGPDFNKIADAFNIKSFKIKTQDDFDKAIKVALSIKKPIILNCQIFEDEKVLPMVAPGSAIHDLILE